MTIVHADQSDAILPLFYKESQAKRKLAARLNDGHSPQLWTLSSHEYEV